ncbi:nitroreductase family protein [Tepidimonas charontis]|uniref:Putative NAD(P)H nitroreductase n=1 Tax=Tepidimonas charontis TaxID=2267262 RepID=A0A554X9X7_9BURK|nr:nitroreductase [Tepidimonas charontis]TSE32621.1 putative NAD(P)H nitroreductase YdjA [Tepidimonas charontis]
MRSVFPSIEAGDPVSLGAAAARQIPVADAESSAAVALEWICTRQTISPKRLVEPGPTAQELDAILRCAAAAPDHGLLRPWRFVIVPAQRRAGLGEVFAAALIDRDPGATLEQIEAAREKAQRAPLLMLVVAQLGAAEPPIPVLERMVSVGAAVQNMLLAAHAMGYGASLTSGQAMTSPRLRALFDLTPGEEAVCFVNIGTVAKRKAARLHPAVESFVSVL